MKRAAVYTDAAPSQRAHDASTATMQELSILEYSLVHRSAPLKAAGALMAAVSFQTKTLRPYMKEIEVRASSLDPSQALTSPLSDLSEISS